MLKTFLIVLKTNATDTLKADSKRAIKKQQKQQLI